jgi:hypothetical protein
MSPWPEAANMLRARGLAADALLPGVEVEPGALCGTRPAANTMGGPTCLPEEPSAAGRGLRGDEAPGRAPRSAKSNGQGGLRVAGGALRSRSVVRMRVRGLRRTLVVVVRDEPCSRASSVLAAAQR